MGLSLLQGVMCVCSGAFSSTLCDPMDCNPPGSSVHGISQARILEWVAISYSVGIDPGMDQESLKGLYHSLNPWWCFPCGICHGWCGLKYFLSPLSRLYVVPCPVTEVGLGSWWWTNIVVTASFLLDHPVGSETLQARAEEGCSRSPAWRIKIRFLVGVFSFEL